MKLIKTPAFLAEHEAVNRLEGPVGQEITRVMSDMEQLISEFTDRGAVDSHSIHQVRAGLDRLEKFGELFALRDDLAERAREVGRLVDFLGDDQGPNAVLRVQSRVEFQMAQVRDLADNAGA
ncbi:hypothetical protein ABZ281_02705 [Streptomyces sp. NPDC006265]|uniref:hypothetical protein n=1 Tax=Streptomyces sp. NPDC006265 TaxID=3156740 RepID=UPI0033B270AC